MHLWLLQMMCVLGVHVIYIWCIVMMCVLAFISYAGLLHSILDPEVMEGDQAAAKDWTAQGWVPGDLYGSTPGQRRWWELGNQQ